jgi:hypothetical protein
MNIAIIGAGNVGGTLGSRWAKNGHTVTFGVRNPGDEKLKKLLGSTGGAARAAMIREAVKDASVVVLATPWEAAQSAIQAAGNLNGKILIDTTNPLSMGPEGLRLVLGLTTSAGEQVASWATGARVVKAFNTTGAKNMADPKLGSHSASMFVCGDDTDARLTVTKLAEELGFEAVDCGPLSAARYLEPMAMLWIHLCVGLGRGPDFAFKIVKR